MHISKILVQNFRSYDRKLLELDKNANLILGSNGSGKTNLLESIYFLSSGKSFRSSSSGQLIKWGEKLSSVRAKVNNKDSESEIEVQLWREDTGSLKRRFLIDKIVKTRAKYWGKVKIVVFEPEDMRLITGSPGRRRDFLDGVFANTEWRYASALSQYYKALKHRNELLDIIASGKAQKAELFYWDQSLLKNSEIIQKFRYDWVKSANSFFINHSDREINKFFIRYQASTISLEKLEQLYPIELAAGHSKCGPHLDDFSIDYKDFQTEDKNLAFWGSRGQQRLAVLALRLAQINYLEEKYDEEPILLLDDIFSELDENHRQIVIEICRKYQTIFSSAENQITNYLPKSLVISL
ncbi:MAG TPA: DNA replication and repair protein RecF [Candidatus Methanoperedens sp.]|nr:DNA replication and repair protein RecF [Candidatus Methanoperedens sp.]